MLLQRTSRNLWGEWMGVMHGDEVEYVFGHPLNVSLKYTEKEAELSLRMIRYFTQFANEGAPTVEEHMWPPYTRDQPRYYIFNAEKINLEKGLRPTACAFWNEFLPRLKGTPDPVPQACNSAIASSVSAGAQEMRNTALITALLLLPTLTISGVM
ncbi:hypothetical protein KM043_016904 [Ampulex compressa]|nr:hypothetical protein KM043_016904 [Ampulex compressa]